MPRSPATPALARRLPGVVALVGALGIAPTARADGPYEGDWRQGAMHIQVAVESWGGDCGPRPQPATVPGGSVIHVTQSGDDLTFAGRPPRSTRGCWSENTAVRPVSHRYEGGTWQITCRTPESDPRGESGQYTLRATGTDHIEFRDTSRYDWQLNGSHCIATMTVTQSFDRVAAAPPPPTATPDAGAPRPREPACTPGAPARIALRPASTDVEPGGRVCFQARVVDGSGCAVPGHTAALTLRDGAAGALRSGCFEATASGEAVVVARDGSLEAEARVRVRVFDLSDLIARRAESGGAVAPAEPETTTVQSSRLAARGEAAPRPSMLAPLAGACVGLVLVLGASIGLVLRRRKRRSSMTAVPSPAGPEAPPAPAPPQSAAAGPPKICPTCRRGHPPEAERCATDGTPLVPYADFVASTQQAGAKTCPTCGTRYPATTRFCGKDGTTLP